VILPPIPTPFDGKGRLDTGAFQELALALEPLVDGLLIYGSNGEGVHLTPDGHPAPLRASLGEGLLRYYEALAERMPLFLYHVPQNTRVDLPLSAVAALGQHPKILGIKDSSGEMPRLAFYQARLKDFRVFTGHAPTFLAALALGAEGGILAAANLAPRAYKALLAHFREGRLAEAQALQRRLYPLGDLLSRGGVPLLKQALRHLGLAAGYPRPPYPQESPLFGELLPVLDSLKEEGWIP